MASPSTPKRTREQGPDVAQLWDDRVIDVLLSAVSGGVVLVGRSGEMVLLNDCAGQLFQLGPGEAAGRPFGELFSLHPGRAAGRPFTEVFSPDSSPHAQGNELSTEPVTLEAMCRRQDGSTVKVGLHISPVLGADNSPGGYVVLVDDLEAKRRREEQTRRIDRLASLGELSAGVAHEVRNPLAGIQTAAEVMAEKVSEDDSRRAFVDVILEEVRRLNRIVEDLLRFARPAPPKLASCDLHKVVGNVLALLSNQVEKEGIRVATSYHPELPPVKVDADQIVQVVLNIVLNAIQAMAGGGVLEISTSVVAAHDGRSGSGEDTTGARLARIEVSDNGPGIPGNALDRVFDPFYTTKRGGTGMGLSICQRIVEAHGGMLSTQSDPGEKTRVWIDLLVED